MASYKYNRTLVAPRVTTKYYTILQSRKTVSLLPCLPRPPMWTSVPTEKVSHSHRKYVIPEVLVDSATNWERHVLYSSLVVLSEVKEHQYKVNIVSNLFQAMG